MIESRFDTRIDATGPNGNVFAVLGAARRMMRELGVDRQEIDDLTKQVRDARSYKEALDAIREWFPVDVNEEDLP